MKRKTETTRADRIALGAGSAIGVLLLAACWVIFARWPEDQPAPPDCAPAGVAFSDSKGVVVVACENGAVYLWAIGRSREWSEIPGRLP